MTQLSAQEQVSLTSGADLWHTVAIPGAGIGALRVSDGPNGARGPDIEGTDTSACFPVGSALAATWDVDLVGEVGRALAFEARQKGAGVLLAPTVNLHRHPLAGRNFECYSEDPHLSARMAVAFVDGLQHCGVGACIKHFVANDSEHRRHTMSSVVSERALRELYLVPFEAAVREAGTWSVMSAYNRINGTYASDHRWLLTTVLREEWGFDGAVISDWGGTMSTVAALEAGLDLEMPGPGRMRRAKLTAALEADETGERLEGPLAMAAGNVARLALRAEQGASLDPALGMDEITALARQAASQSMVLLRNDGTLPLSLETTIAVIGPNAERGQIQGGGSSQVRPHRSVSPLEGLTARIGDESRLRFEPGCTRRRYRPPVPNHLLATPDGEPGVERTIFEGDVFGLTAPAAGEVPEAASTDLVPGLHLRFFGPIPAVDRPDQVSARLRTILTPELSGVHVVGLASAGVARALVDGVEVVSASWTEHPGETFYGFGSSEQTGTVELTAGRPVELVVEYNRAGASMVAGIRIGISPPEPDDLLERALDAARAADVAVVVVGLDGEWETEGSDRVDMALPGRQDELIAAVAAANPATVVVLNAGSPVYMRWVDEVAAVVQAWYPGQEFGAGLADVLFGDVNPSARLPTTFPRRIEDSPAYPNYPGEDDEVRYAEEVFVGYRHYDTAGVEPLFCFGHGLSYTSFEYGDVAPPTAQFSLEGTLSIELAVTNVGDRAGAEVVQLYLADLDPKVPRPTRELRGFRRIELAPGESGIARFDLVARDFAFWDAEGRCWRVEAGRFDVALGASSRDLRRSLPIEVTAGATWGPGEAGPGGSALRPR